jgi:hypothetical protein
MLLDNAMDDILPEQIVCEEGVAVTVGSGLTVTVTEAVLVHPLPSVPVTV